MKGKKCVSEWTALAVGSNQPLEVSIKHNPKRNTAFVDGVASHEQHVSVSQEMSKQDLAIKQNLQNVCV